MRCLNILTPIKNSRGEREKERGRDETDRQKANTTGFINLLHIKFK